MKILLLTHPMPAEPFMAAIRSRPSGSTSMTKAGTPIRSILTSVIAPSFPERTTAFLGVSISTGG